jgi:septal ring factor EnvC (AmiA/AmiB activator)
MSFHSLPAEFEQFVERARAALSQKIATAKNIAAAANAERGQAQAALADLEARCKSTQDQLDALNDELGRRTTLAGLNREIAAAGKKLKALQVETAEAEKALEALQKQRADGERRLVALGNEAQRQLAIRLEAEAAMGKLRSQLDAVQIGR